MNVKTLVLLILGALLAAGGLVLRALARKFPEPAADAQKPEVRRYRRRKRLPAVLFWLGVWLSVTALISLLFGPSQREFSVEILPPLTSVLGLPVSSAVLTGFSVSGALILLAVLFRLLVFPRFTETPHGLQNVVELAVEWLSRYCRANLCRPLGENLAAYLFTVALYMIGCAAVELLGLRAPTSDILTTFAMALVTFFLINFYGIRSKGLGGRLRSMSRPTPVIFPIKILTDVAVPVSLACRLFGNMLGGMIVMELLYFALGNAAFGAPAVLGLYFNVFHPLIQVFIFITLSLTFINEAIE